MANLSNINNKFLFTDGDFLKIGNLAPINNISGTESGISITNGNCASITLDNSAAQGKTFSIYSAVNGSLNFYDVAASSGRLVINSAGNSTFAGTVQATQFTATNGLNYLKRNTDASLQLRSENTRSGLFITKPATDTVMGSALVMADESYRFGTASYYHQIMLQNGNTYFNQNVGIGTTTPYAQLHVSHSLGNGGIMLGNTATTGSKEMLFNIHPLGLIWQRWVNGAYQANLMTLDYDGKLGIGTTSPDSKLHVESTSATGANFILETTHSGGIPLLDLKGAASAQVRYKDELNVIQGRIDFGDSGTFNFIDVPNNSSTLYLKTGGNVGIGTTTPDTRLHVVGPGGAVNPPSYSVFDVTIENSGQSDLGIIGTTYSGIYFGDAANALEGALVYSHSDNHMSFRTNGNSEKMRITSAGALEIKGSSTNANSSAFITNNNNITIIGSSTSGSVTKDMSFHTGAERMRITSGGVIQNDPLTTTQSGAVRISNNASGGNFTYGMIIEDDSTNTGFILFSAQNGDSVGSITRSGLSTSFNTSSDYRLKEDLQDFTGLDMVSKIPVYDFKWKTDESRSYGVMAHELQEVLPQAVTGEKDAEEMQSVDYSKIVPLLVKSIQELKADNDSLKARIETLEDK